MKRKIILLSACLLLASGCGSKIPTLDNGEEAIVKFNNDKMFSINDLYNELKDTYALKSLINLIDQYIIEDKYSDQIEEAKEEARLTRESIITQFGDEVKATEAVQYYMGLSSLDAYEEYVYLSVIQEIAINAYAKAQITDKQIEKHYADEIVGDIKVSHILIVPDVTDDMTADEKTKATEEAENESKEIIKKLQEAENVAETFATLAKEQSDDSSTASDGGNMGYINKNTLSASYKTFATEAYKLADGKFTTSAIKSDLGYHIILKVETKEKATLDSLKDSITETLATNLIENDAVVSVDALRELRKEYGMEIVDTDIQKQYTNYIQNALTTAEETNKSKTETK